MNLVVLLGIFIATTFTGGYAQDTYSPEETLFTYTRCMEDNHGGDYGLAKKWMNWELQQDAKSACYAKCVLVGLGLFDEKSKTFTSDCILPQYQKYKSYTDQNEAGVKEFADAVKKLGTIGDSGCIAVVQKYLPLHKQYTDVQRNVFFGKKEITDKVYKADSSVKKRDETMFRFCERNNFQNGAAELCQLRKSGITTNNNHLDCIFRGLRYLDRNGNINPAEIKRDLHLIGVTDKDAEVDNALNNCQVEEATKALCYNDCLWKNDKLKDHMMPAFDYREVRSESYRYMLSGPKTYNRDEVKAKVQQYDRDAGCQSKVARNWIIW